MMTNARTVPQRGWVLWCHIGATVLGLHLHDIGTVTLPFLQQLCHLCICSGIYIVLFSTAWVTEIKQELNGCVNTTTYQIPYYYVEPSKYPRW